jgi:hypothetical protein
MPAPLGLSAKLYRLTTGTRATWGAADANLLHAGPAPANLEEIGNVRDLTITLDKGEADVTTRANLGWRANKATLKDGGIEWQMVYDETDTDVLALLKSWIGGTSIALAALSGASTVVGVTGLWADFEVFKFEKGEELENAQMVSVGVKPTYSLVAPEWVKVTA